ncbi:glycine/D-amino acid oxidase-like deaminating enzyme [Labedella gwakjiensis]|uniref:FAD-dependent oxidoreductase n=1 Tax=Labedella gwakjiensis TaxID=390269 RepID=A0A2P8GSK4_9MICO|nr:FAD-dependent oxidoreductase [Labedella gwakjiensis]PSL36950.1 glycine/D-amino acid oxidase-like deaminating enzyme [Labedella gwakjiensis]RUQ81746.1 FAD-dependent oxidoreductase [Labedella gwakjiensis]
MGDTVFERRPPATSAVERALEGSRQGVFWLDDLGVRDTHESLAGDTTTDLLIVGGGYTGLWTALRALERDPSLRVTVVEAKTIGWAASGRNGGFVEASLTHGSENGARRWPDELVELERLGVENLDGIEQTVARYALDCEFERTGYLSVAVEPHQVPWLEESDGEGGARFLGQDEMRGLVNSPTYLAGLSVPPRDSALVHPAKLAAELARVVQELGGTIHENTLVRGIEKAGGGVSVRTSGGTVTAQQVVLGTNAFPSLLARNRLMTVPVYDYVLMTEPLTAAQKADIGWEGRQGIGDLANQFHYYRQSADNRILWGGYDAVYHSGGKIRPEYERRPESFRKLASHFLTTFPQLEGIRFSHTWAGVIDTSTQFSAFFGTAFGGRVAYAAGFTGLGVGATRFAADVMLDLLSGEETERTRLEMVRKRPLPFPPEPAASIGVNATRWSLDRADHNDGRRNVLLKTLDALGLGFDS